MNTLWQETVPGRRIAEHLNGRRKLILKMQKKTEHNQGNLKVVLESVQAMQ
jgi:hypothetical protein